MAGYPSPSQHPQGYPPQGYDPNQPPGYPQAPPPKKGIPTWVIVLMAAGGFIVIFGGVMASLAIYGVRKYIATAKSAEALSSLGQIGVLAASAYEKEVANARGQTVHRMCPSASTSVPASLSSIKGAKYQSAPADWSVDQARNAGFSCLGFSMATPQYFLYRYTASGASKVGDSFDAEADADLAGTGDLTTYHLGGAINAAHSLEITVTPSLGAGGK